MITCTNGRETEMSTRPTWQTVTEEMARDFELIQQRIINEWSEGVDTGNTVYRDALSEWLAKHFPAGESEAVELTAEQGHDLWEAIYESERDEESRMIHDYLASLGLKLVRVKPEAAKAEPPLLKPGDPCPRFKEHPPVKQSRRDGWLYCPQCHAEYAATWHREEAEGKPEAAKVETATYMQNLASKLNEAEQKREADRFADIERRIDALELGYRDAKSTNAEIQDDVDRLDAATAELLEWCKRLSRDRASDTALEARKPETPEKSAGRVFSEAEVREAVKDGKHFLSVRRVAERLGIDLEAK